jgi:hypothetical protein
MNGEFSMNDQIQIFKSVIRAVDPIHGTICLKGPYAEETSNLSVSSLIPYFARDIFLAQKDEPLLRIRIQFKVIAGTNRPSIEVSLPEGIREENFKMIQSYLTQIFWSYNFITYNAKTDCYYQRFNYEFVLSPHYQLLKEAA